MNTGGGVGSILRGWMHGIHVHNVLCPFFNKTFFNKTNNVGFQGSDFLQH